MVKNSKPVCGSCTTPAPSSDKYSSTQVQHVVTKTLCGCGSGCESCSPEKPFCGCSTKILVPVKEQPHNIPCPVTVVPQFYTTTLNSFNMPACNKLSEAIITGASESLIPGLILYSKGVGSLYVDSIDGDSVYLRNKCDNAENLEPGERIDEKTKWGVGFPPYAITITSSAQDLTTPFLASDLVVPPVYSVSPPVAGTATVKVTTINGLSGGDVIEFAGVRYKLVSIIDAKTIVIRNEGEGGEVNSLIRWDEDCDGNPNYVISVISGVNPCDKDAVTEGLLVVCNGGAQTNLKGSESADGKVTWDHEAGTFKVQSESCANCAPCTEFSCCLILDPENEDQEYILTVEDSSIFTSGNYPDFDPLLLEIGEYEFIFIEVISETQIRISPNFEVTEIIAINGPGQICIADCCRLLLEEFTELQEEIDALTARVVTLESEMDAVQTVITNLNSINDNFLIPQCTPQVYRAAVPVATGGIAISFGGSFPTLNTWENGSPVNLLQLNMPALAAALGQIGSINCTFQAQAIIQVAISTGMNYPGLDPEDRIDLTGYMGQANLHWDNDSLAADANLVFAHHGIADFGDVTLPVSGGTNSIQRILNPAQNFDGSYSQNYAATTLVRSTNVTKTSVVNLSLNFRYATSYNILTIEPLGLTYVAYGYVLLQRVQGL